MFNFPLNAVHVHLLLNHAPIVLSAFIPFILAYGLYRNNKDVINLSLVAFILVTLITVPVFISGGEARKTVAKIPDINLQALRMHNRAANITLDLVILLGVLSLAVLYLNMTGSGKDRRYVYYAILVVSIITFGSASITGYYGGNIRHTEIYAPSA